LICILIAILAAAGSIRVAAQSSESFRYQGIARDTELASLTARFPSSSHEFWGKDALFILSTDNAEEFRHRIAQGAGEYLVRISEKESKDHVYYLDAKIDGGITNRLRLSFERPDNIKPARGYVENKRSRSPPCSPVLADLSKRYGKPEGPDSVQEEALENLTYSWRNSSEELKLVCGKYQGQRDIFAMEVIFSRPQSN